MSIEISTYNIAESTCNALNGKATVDEVMSVWHTVGMCIRTQLAMRKGVKLSKLGTFSLSPNNDPVFVLSSDMVSQYKLRQKNIPVDNIPIVPLNYQQIASACEIARDVVDKIYNRFVSCLCRSIGEGRKITLSFYKVAEFSIFNGELWVEFMKEFSSLLRTPENARNKKFAEPPRVAGLASRPEKKSAAAPSPGRPSSAPRHTKAAEILAFAALKQRPRDRDPITGDRGSELSYREPKARPRNPITGEGGSQVSSRSGSARAASAGARRYSTGSVASQGSRGSLDTMSLMHSPRSQASTPRGEGERRPATSGGGARGSSGSQLRRETLEQHQRALEKGKASASKRPMDARAVAAKALDVGNIVQKVRDKIIARGGSNGIKSLQKLLAIMDHNGDKRLSKEEFKFGLRDYGIELSPMELEQVFLHFDRSRDGFIDITEFLVAMRGELNQRRKKIIRMAFNILDTDGDGEITLDEIMAIYDTSWHPEVRSGKITPKQAAVQFMRHWHRNGQDGVVGPEEFEDYYKDVSAGIDDDDYFELMMRNAWRIAGGEGYAENTANRRVLVKNADGSQSIQMIRNELGLRAGDVDGVKARLAQQGVNAASVEFYGGIDTRPKGATMNRPAGAISGVGRQQGAGSGAAMAGVFGKGMGPMVKEAWGQAGTSSGKAVRGDAELVFDPMETLRVCLYSPPVSLEHLCAKLAVSATSATPRIAQGAFMARLSVLDPTLSKSQLAALWRLVSPAGVGSIEVSGIYELLAGKFGRDKSSKDWGLIEKVKTKILERCGREGGIKGLQKTLMIMDDNGDKKLSKEELRYGLRDYGVDLNLRELEDIFSHFDRDKNGFVDVDEFLIGIRGELNARRKAMVKMAFDILDRDLNGVVTVDEVASVYDVSQHPDVLAGKKTPQQVLREFVDQWDRHDHNGIITLEEFEDYYKGISAGIDGDDYFELMIRNAWRIAGGEGDCENTANRRVFVTHADGSQSIHTIKNELGLRADDYDGMKARLAQQGVKAQTIGLHGGVDTRKPAKGQAPPPPRYTSRNSSSGSDQGSQTRGQGLFEGKGRAGGQYAQRTTISNTLNHHQRPRSGSTPRRQYTLFEKNLAATKIAAAFRGRLGRKRALIELRKVATEAQMQRAQAVEANRPRVQIFRPKPRSSLPYGF